MDEFGLLGLGLSENMKLRISASLLGTCSRTSVKYLGVLIRKTNEEMIEYNVTPLILYLQQKCQAWQPLFLSLIGKIAVCKNGALA